MSTSTAEPIYEVFLSFRGEDTRDNFTDHLYNALRRKGIKTFIDNNDLERGKKISAALLTAIEESRIWVIVFSENYASSKWCLDELVHILKCQREDRKVIPVFYKVDPSHLRNLSGSFGNALAEHERKFRTTGNPLAWLRNLLTSWSSDDDREFKHNMEKLQGWGQALKDVGRAKGWHYTQGSEYKFIENIVKDISEQVLRYCDFNVAAHPVGIQSRVRDIHCLLNIGENDVRMVGIWGIGGVGKTTIAKAVFRSLAYKFDGSCFLENVGKCSMDKADLVNLQSQILSDILRVKRLESRMSLMKNRLTEKKVLLIVDDVNELNQLTELCGSLSWFGSGSRIIITTRDKRLLTNHQVKLIYVPKELDAEEALELFSANAFPEETIPVDYLQLAHRLVPNAEGLPSALISLGSELCGRTIAQWQEELDCPSVYLKSCLYESLQMQIREVFLDIACFFNGQDRNHVIQILEGCGKPDTIISELEEKALISIDDKNHILMCKMLQVMGKDEVRLESPNDPSMRSRLWFSDDVYAVLTDCKGTEKIKGVMVEFPEPVTPQQILLSDRSFSLMENLEFFINSNALFSGSLGNLPNNLRLIDWPDFPFLSLPSNFIPKKLVKLRMPGSSISQLGVNFKCCRYLKYINLERSDYLTEVLNFSECPNVKELNLSYCRSLLEVDDSVGLLDKLVVLNLSGCEELAVFPRRVALKSVKCIDLSGCRKLSTFCEIVEDMEALTSLDLSGTAISELPRSIYELHGLIHLDMQSCTELVTFPRWNIDQRLPTNLRYLNLCGCVLLHEIPELPPNVEQVIADGCGLLERFAVLSNILERKPLQMIEHISLYNCKCICDNLPHGVAGNKGTLFCLIHSSKQSEFDIVFPGSVVPSWFRHRKYLMELDEKCEFCFEIHPNFNKGLAICASATAPGNSGECSFAAEIYINGESKCRRVFRFKSSKMQYSDHVWLLYMPFVKLGLCHPPFTCQVRLKHSGQDSVRCTIFGVHLVGPQDVYEDDADDKDLEDEHLAREKDAEMTDQVEDDKHVENTRPEKRIRLFGR